MGAPHPSGAALHDHVRAALERLSTGRWQETVGEALAMLGGALVADRLTVFQNLRGPDGRLWMDLVAEWRREGIRCLFNDPNNHLHPYYPDFARWIDVMDQGGSIAGVVADMPTGERDVLAAEGTVTTVQVPIFAGDEWWGFVALDHCAPDRDLTAEDEVAIRATAGSIGQAVMRERAREDERLKQDLFRSMVENGPAVIYIDGVDDSASTLYISPQILGLTGYSAEEWSADADMWPRVLHPDDRVRAIAENARHNETGDPFVLEYRMIHRDGHVVWVHDEATMVRDDRGMPRYSHGVMMDISARKRMEDQAVVHAYHDELTGLPSRAMFDELLDLSIARARRRDGAVAVLCVDLDDFRLVNDSLGHRTGDALLLAVAERLREATRETDLVARRGADQFLLLLSDLEREEGGLDSAIVRAQSVAQRIHESFSTAFEIDGTEVYVSAGIGVAFFPDDADDHGSLQRAAEAAMYESKKGGPASVVMATMTSADSGAKLQFVTRLRKATEAQRWTLYYQPVVALSTGQMVGVEALIRWIEPDGTMVPPNDFIPLAEELGLIEQIGDWVVREIAYQVQAWRELDIDLEVGFNLSPRQFWQPDLAARIVKEFRVGGVDPSRVLVEVTESSAMLDPDRAQEILLELSDQGFAIAIDDFGTGYSSLSRLREMPVRVLKIDRTFVNNVDRDPASASILGAFIHLAKGLSMTTLAEGIETAEELAFLRAAGCELGQGFYFSKPVPPEEVIAYAFGGIPAARALLPS